MTLKHDPDREPAPAGTRRKLRPPRMRALRAELLAPDLERYLSMREVDFSMTDQVEALQVRVRRGVEVLEKRLEATALLARKRARAWSLVVGVAACGALCLIAQPLLAVGAAFPGLGACVPLAGYLADLSLLREVAGKHSRLVDVARTREQLLRFAAEALAEARELGVLPPG